MENEKKTGDKYSKLAGNTLIFAISSFSSKLLTLIVQPFLTYAMAEISDLGLSKILSQYANLLIPFVSMGMSNAIIRFGLDKGNSEKQVFTNGLLTILGGFGILVLCWPITQFLPDMAQYGLLIYIYVLMSCLRTLCTQFVRSRQWNKLVAVDGVLCTVATMAFYVLYLVGFKWGANGYLLAIISGDLASVLFLMFTGKLWNYVELKGINKGLWKQMLRFSLPMIPAQISFWIINASDLFFVREMCNGLDGRDGSKHFGVSHDEGPRYNGRIVQPVLVPLGIVHMLCGFDKRKPRRGDSHTAGPSSGGRSVQCRTQAASNGTSSADCLCTETGSSVSGRLGRAEALPNSFPRPGFDARPGPQRLHGRFGRIHPTSVFAQSDRRIRSFS